MRISEAKATRLAQSMGGRFMSNYPCKLVGFKKLLLPPVFEKAISYMGSGNLRIALGFYFEDHQIKRPEGFSYIWVIPEKAYKNAFKLYSPDDKAQIRTQFISRRLDGSGKLELPEGMLRAVGFRPSDKLVMIGCLEHLEIWKKADFEKHIRDLSNDREFLQALEKLHF